MEHPQALAAAGRAGAPRPFARNQLCALVAPGIDASPQTLVERLLDAKVRVGTSTPKADPSGDYAWMMFERIEQSGRSRRLRHAERQGAATHRRPQLARAAGRPQRLRRA